MSAELQSEILSFYSDPAAPYASRQDRKARNRIQNELQHLRAARLASESAQAP